MYRIYEMTRTVNGVPTPEIIMLFHPGFCDFSRVLHEVGMKFCLTKQGRQLCHNEGSLSLKRLMDCITPEMLEPYGVTMIRPREAAIKVDQEPPVIGKYEAESYLQLRDNFVERFRRLYDNAKRFARHLESKQTSQHPIVATWDGEKVVTKALVWANQYVSGKERDWHNFIKNRLDELTSGMCGSDAFPFEEEAAGVPIGQ